MHHFQRHLIQAIHLLRLRGASKAELQPFLDIFDWEFVASGGDNTGGIIDNLDSCPCQHEYTVATDQTVIAAWPNAAVQNNCVANPPAPAAAEWKCPDDCVQVMTHIWHGWDVLKNTKTGKIVFNCNTFAQYHCKKPTDPDRNKDPRHANPKDPEL